MTTAPPPVYPARTTLHVGLALTVAALVAVHLDRVVTHALAAHIRSGYPSWGEARVGEAVSLWAVILSAVGALGVGGWLLAIWATRAGRSWARWLVAALFAVGGGTALTLLTVRDTSGDTGLPPVLGSMWLLPALAGLAVVVLVWRGTRPAPRPTT